MAATCTHVGFVNWSIHVSRQYCPKFSYFKRNYEHWRCTHSCMLFKPNGNLRNRCFLCKASYIVYYNRCFLLYSLIYRPTRCVGVVRVFSLCGLEGCLALWPSSRSNQRGKPWCAQRINDIKILNNIFLQSPSNSSMWGYSFENITGSEPSNCHTKILPII